MESLTLRNTSYTNIELGVIKSFLSKRLYLVGIAGVDKKVYNTSINDLNIGDTVLISKLQSGRRYIITKTGFTKNTKTNKRVYING